VLKAGKLKDMLSPLRPIDPAARSLMEALLKETHEQFIKAVAEGRRGKLTEAQVRELADGRVFSGQQAEKNGLIDELGGMQQALAAAGRLAGVAGKARLKEYRPPGLLRWLLGGAAAKTQPSYVNVTGGLLYDDVAAHLSGVAPRRRIEPGEM